MTDQPVWLPQAHVPVLRLDDVLLVAIQGDLQDKNAERLQQDVLEQIAADPAKGVIIDISSVEVVDSFLGRVLAEIAAGARLLAAETIVAGMRPTVAITLVELGLTLTGLRTALDVQRALRMLREQPVRPAREHGERGAYDYDRD
jgi:rsbT antagonist protein RsbS